jgi:hypothetical protein
MGLSANTLSSLSLVCGRRLVVECVMVVSPMNALSKWAPFLLFPTDAWLSMDSLADAL